MMHLLDVVVNAKLDIRYNYMYIYHIYYIYNLHLYHYYVHLLIINRLEVILGNNLSDDFCTN